MKIKSFLLYSIIASCFTEHLFAESVTTNALQTITVEATRLDANIMETPQFVEVLTKQDIEASGSSDIMDALEKRGSIFLRHSNQSPSNSRAFSPSTLDQSFPSRIVLTHLKDSS